MIATFWSAINDYVRDMKEGFVREIFNALSTLGIPFILWLSGILAKHVVSDYMFFTGVIFVTTFIGVILRAKHTQYKRMILIERGYVNVLKV